MNFINIITKQAIKSIESSDSLTGLIKQQVKEKEQTKYPENYFYLTELVNLPQSYWNRTNRIEPERDILLKFAIGNKLHRLAGTWFDGIAGFESPESTINGIWADIPGVKGRIDFRYNESIVEIKSKPEIVSNETQIVDNYIQDLEQLVFYAAISTIKHDIHYLIFIHQEMPHPITAFKVQIKDFQPIKQLIQERITILKQSIEEGNATPLGRCRYYPECQYNRQKQCDCGSSPIMDKGVLIDNVTLTRDFQMEKMLNTEKGGCYAKYCDTISWFQLMYPRKWYKESILGYKDEFEESALLESRKSLLWESITSVKEFKYSQEKKKNYRKTTPITVTIPSNYIKFYKDDGEEVLVPFVYKVSKVQDKSSMIPHKYHLAQIAIMCALTNSDTGVIFITYPYIDNSIKSYVITFKDIQQINNQIDDRIALLVKSQNEENYEILPKCEEWQIRQCAEGCICKSQQ